MDLHLAGQRALITGGSKGIGRATAILLAEEGVHVTIAARDPAALAETADHIRARAQVRVATIAADLSQESEVQRLAAEAGEIDILVNNAGAIPPGTLTKVDDETWRRAWDLKVFGFISLCRAVYPGMAARKSGVIVNVIGFVWALNLAADARGAYGVDVNAISVVNLIAAVGLAVEFGVHIAAAFSRARGSRVERATQALVDMGASVFSGITVTKLVGVSVLLAYTGRHSFLQVFESFVLLLLAVFTPWSAINLVDFYVFTRSRYDVPALSDPDGRYGRWNATGIAIYLIGIVIQIPFLATSLYTGPLVAVLHGVDVSWILGLVVPAALYYVFGSASRRRAPPELILPPTAG